MTEKVLDDQKLITISCRIVYKVLDDQKLITMKCRIVCKVLDDKKLITISCRIVYKVLDDQKLITIKCRIVFIYHYFQTRSGIHSDFYPGGRLVNKSGHKAHHKLNFDAEVKKEGNFDSPLQ